ncbi:MAG TPA: histidine kinase dimerization/phospho-acceptor domain-containing protein [Acidisphaera sp.]|nr:histidine kinase dimerization/phospho-acceptor domain-containing protein [Acidisphaera sp.]
MADEWNRAGRRPGSGAGRSAPAAGDVAPDSPAAPSGAIAGAALLAGLADTIAHRFNNLLTVLLGSLEQLRAQKLDELGVRQLDRAEASAQLVARLAAQMLAVARRDGGHAEDVELNAVVSGCDLMLGQAAGDRATLTLELSPETLPVRLDPVALELALLALLRDAAGAAPGPRSVVVRTAARVIDGGEDRQTVELSVTDSRCATPPDLSTIDRVVAGCGGTVAVETNEETTVRLVFPRAQGA